MSVTISGDFIRHVRKIYFDSLDFMVTKKGVRYGINGFANDGLPSYVMAVASIESFVNETFLKIIPKVITRKSFLWNLPKNWVDTVDLNVKLLLFPQLLFGVSFSHDAQPYQDMVLLIKIRNDLIHYKMQSQPPKYIMPLNERGIILPALDIENSLDYLWQHKLNCSEGIRWAHNTACKVVNSLYDFIPQNYQQFIEGSVSNFQQIPESLARDWLSKYKINPDSNFPEFKPIPK
ncbi:MAG: hypothetical protein HY960_08815 [Ignavibacteriae bacterium]|nr:hypothetical protein [Ignavibacteriota bacterium]